MLSSAGCEKRSAGTNTGSGEREPFAEEIKQIQGGGVELEAVGVRPAVLGRWLAKGCVREATVQAVPLCLPLGDGSINLILQSQTHPFCWAP